MRYASLWEVTGNKGLGNFGIGKFVSKFPNLSIPDSVRFSSISRKGAKRTQSSKGKYIASLHETGQYSILQLQNLNISFYFVFKSNLDETAICFCTFSIHTCFLW